MSAKASRLAVITDWHYWDAEPPDPRAGKVRCIRHGVQFLIDAATAEPWWPPRDVQWQETWQQRPRQ